MREPLIAITAVMILAIGLCLHAQSTAPPLPAVIARGDNFALDCTGAASCQSVGVALTGKPLSPAQMSLYIYPWFDYQMSAPDSNGMVTVNFSQPVPSGTRFVVLYPMSTAGGQ